MVQMSVLVGIAATIALGVTLAVYFSLNSASPGAPPPFQLPPKFTVSYDVVWRSPFHSRPANGFTTIGVVSVDTAASALMYSLENYRDGVLELKTSFMRNLIFAFSNGNNTCVTSYNPPNIHDITPDTLQGGLEEIVGYVPPSSDSLITGGEDSCSDGKVYSFQAMNADHIMCVKDSLPVWVAGDAYVLRVKKLESLSELIEELPSTTTTSYALCVDPEDSTKLVNGDAVPGASNRIRQLFTSSSSYKPSYTPINFSKVIASSDDQRWWKSHVIHDDDKHDRALNARATMKEATGAELKHVCYIHGMGNKGLNNPAHGSKYKPNATCPHSDPEDLPSYPGIYGSCPANPENAAGYGAW